MFLSKLHFTMWCLASCSALRFFKRTLGYTNSLASVGLFSQNISKCIMPRTFVNIPWLMLLITKWYRKLVPRVESYLKNELNVLEGSRQDCKEAKSNEFSFECGLHLSLVVGFAAIVVVVRTSMKWYVATQNKKKHCTNQRKGLESNV